MDDLVNLHQHGVFLRRHALENGYDDRWLNSQLRSGSLVRIRHGAYTRAETWSAIDESARHVLHCQAVALSHRTEIAFSHISGAALHELRIWGIDLSRVHLTRLGATAARKHRDVAYHEIERSVELTEVQGLPVLTVEDCVVGAATLCGIEAGMALVDSAYHLAGSTEDSLRLAAERMSGWPGTRRLQLTLRLARPGSESVGESRSRYIFWRARIPEPDLQYVVRDGNQIVGVADFAWPEYGLIGEFDGRVKYGRYLRPGESPGDAVYREKLREDRIRALGFRVIRFTWADLAAPDRMAARVRAALAGEAA